VSSDEKNRAYNVVIIAPRSASHPKIASDKLCAVGEFLLHRDSPRGKGEGAIIDRRRFGRLYCTVSRARLNYAPMTAPNFVSACTNN